MSRRESRRGRAPGLAPSTAALALWFAVGASAARVAMAHEYWLDPLDATPEANGPLFANVRNGQDFVGSSFPFDPARMARLELVGPAGRAPLPARLGDFPAVHATLGGAGLYLVVLDTYGKELVYDDLATFATFLAYHGLEARLADHAARALPETGIREIYFRHVKTLVRADDPDAGGTVAGGRDAPSPLRAEVFAPQGQRLELVPENDPYADDEIRVRLRLDGEPLADAQMELFERTPGGEVSRVVTRSDARGRATFDVARSGDYLVNAVQVFEPGRDARALDGAPPHWESRWASLTFERP